MLGTPPVESTNGFAFFQFTHRAASSSLAIHPAAAPKPTRNHHADNIAKIRELAAVAAQRREFEESYGAAVEAVAREKAAMKFQHVQSKLVSQNAVSLRWEGRCAAIRPTRGRTRRGPVQQLTLDSCLGLCPFAFFVDPSLHSSQFGSSAGSASHSPASGSPSSAGRDSEYYENDPPSTAGAGGGSSPKFNQFLKRKPRVDPSECGKGMGWGWGGE